MDDSASLQRARSVAFALCAALLGENVHPLVDGATLPALATALDAGGRGDLAERIRAVQDPPDEATLAGRWVRWFDLGRVAPYEGSNVAPTAGGVTPRLADIAGFYRAFNLATQRNRPDHVVAQLEFLAITLLAEAESTEEGDSERAAVAAKTTRMFLRDHIGVWIDAWAGRVAAIDDLAPWAPLATTAVALVRHEAQLRNVVPLRNNAVLPADAGLADEVDAELECSNEPEDAVLG